MKNSRRVEHNGEYCPACSENAIMPGLPKCAKAQFIEKSLGFDPDTIDGDYAEAYHHSRKMWDKSEIDVRFDFNQESK